jgi:hypothetical protein
VKGLNGEKSVDVKGSEYPPNIITRHPRRTSLWARSAIAIPGVEMPWMSKILSPSSGPNTYTLTLPYGELTSLAPGRASGGYGSCCTSSSDKCGSFDCTGDGMTVIGADLKTLDTVPSSSRVPREAAPICTYGWCRSGSFEREMLGMLGMEMDMEGALAGGAAPPPSLESQSMVKCASVGVEGDVLSSSTDQS